jgi:hypothetical protein
MMVWLSKTNRSICMKCEGRVVLGKLLVFQELGGMLSLQVKNNRSYF